MVLTPCYNHCCLLSILELAIINCSRVKSIQQSKLNSRRHRFVWQSATQRVPVGHKTGADFYLTSTSHSNLELTPISRSINNSVNNTLQTFTVHKCHIKRVAYEWCQILTTHQWIESKVHRIESICVFSEWPSSSLLNKYYSKKQIPAKSEACDPYTQEPGSEFDLL